MNIRPYRGQLPRLGQNVYVDPAAVVVGDVELGDDASLWPFTVARGDVNFICIGARTNIQDGSVLHVTHDGPYIGLASDGSPTLRDVHHSEKKSRQVNSKELVKLVVKGDGLTLTGALLVLYRPQSGLGSVAIPVDGIKINQLRPRPFLWLCF